MTDTATARMSPRLRRTDDGWMRSILRGQKFEGRGFSKRTVDALLAHGVSAPERLLFMIETELQNILVSQGQNMVDAIRQIGVSEVTFYRWRQEFGG